MIKNYNKPATVRLGFVTGTVAGFSDLGIASIGLGKCNMQWCKIAKPLHIDDCGLLVHFERLQNSCKEKVPKTRLCANCIRKSRKSEDFRPFFGRGDRI